jgi:hypothetical protein
MSSVIEVCMFVGCEVSLAVLSKLGEMVLSENTNFQFLWIYSGDMLLLLAAVQRMYSGEASTFNRV